MHNSARLGVLLALLPTWTAAAGAATPASGTLDPLNATLVYTGGPYTAANPSNNLALVGTDGEPICDPGGATCDDFLLTVDLPPGYQALHPTHRITISIFWPNDTSDFDLYVQDPTTGVSVTSSASSADPEVATLPAVAGTYRLRNLVFTAVNETFTGTITLGPTPPSPYREGQYRNSSDVWTCNTHLEGEALLFDHGGDAEPSAKFTPNGVFYMSGIAGVGAGSGLWRTTDVCGQTYQWLGTPDAGVGGGDSDVEVAGAVNGSGFFNVYTSSLTLANTTVTVSQDNGQTHLVSPASNATPVNDRQWQAAYGADTAYLSYRTLNAGNQLFVVRSDLGGLPGSYLGPFLVYSDVVVEATLATQLGNMVADKRPGATVPVAAGPDGEGNVYHGFTLEGTKVYVAVSRDFGVTWSSKLVWEDPDPAQSHDHIFTWVAVDLAGNVYIAFSDDHNIYYAYSTDQAETWSPPIRVSNGTNSKTAVFPQMAAGSDGRLVFSWYGAAGGSAADPANQWQVFVARTQNGLDAFPIFEQTIASDHIIHFGEICQAGLDCSCCRELLECFEIDINPLDGSAALVYTDNGALGGLYVTRQVAGQSSLAGKDIVDRSLVCPTLLNQCSEPVGGDPCELPGLSIVTDPAGDVPGNATPEFDLLGVFMAELYDPSAAGPLYVTMRVAGLDPDNLPPDALWRVNWTNPADGNVYFMSMTTCDPLDSPSFNYGWVDPVSGISTQLGVADGGTIDASGQITVWTGKALLGNPQPGHALTAISGTTRIYAGALCTGLILQLDGTANGVYTVQGNSACQAVPTAQISTLEVRPTAEGVELSWSALHIGGLDRFRVYRATAATSLEVPVAELVAVDTQTDYRVVDRAVPVGELRYRVTAVAQDGAEVTVGEARVDARGPINTLAMSVAGSNPFVGATQISYTLPRQSAVEIAVYNLAGRRVRTLVSEVQAAGRYSLSFDRRDEQGIQLAAGVYLVRLVAEGQERSVRVTAF